MNTVDMTLTTEEETIEYRNIRLPEQLREVIPLTDLVRNSLLLSLESLSMRSAPLVMKLLKPMTTNPTDMSLMTAGLSSLLTAETSTDTLSLERLNMERSTSWSLSKTPRSPWSLPAPTPSPERSLKLRLMARWSP